MKKYISDEEEKYATFQNLGVCSTIFKKVLFLSKVSPMLHLFDEKYSKNGYIVKYYSNFL